MNRFVPNLIALIVLLATAATAAHAHFLWAHIARGEKPALRLIFSEEPEEKTLPALLGRLKPSRIADGNGKSLVGKAETDAFVVPLSNGSGTTGVAYADQTWGVMDRTKQDRGIFLLEYHAKAANTEADAAKPTNQYVEVLATRAGRSLTVEVRENNKSAPKATVFLYMGKTRDAKVTDARGKTAFDLPAVDADFIALRADVAQNKAGTHENKPYQLVRHYATLTFPAAAYLSGSAGGAASLQADPNAYALLKSAHDNRRTMGDDFPGLSADVVMSNDDGKEFAGTVLYDKNDGAKLTLVGAPDDAKRWAEGQTMNLLGHRRGGDFAKGDGKNPITFADDDKSPFGRQVRLNDTLKSEYRVKGNIVTEVTRTMGGDRFTITVLETTDAGGKYLPRHFLVTYYDATAGHLKRMDAYTDTHALIENRWVPTSRRIVSSDNGKLTSRTLTLKNIRFGSVATADKP